MSYNSYSRYFLLQLLTNKIIEEEVSRRTKLYFSGKVDSEVENIVENPPENNLGTPSPVNMHTLPRTSIERKRFFVMYMICLTVFSMLFSGKYNVGAPKGKQYEYSAQHRWSSKILFCFSFQEMCVPELYNLLQMCYHMQQGLLRL